MFPTSLCGVLVFDSASRPSSRPPPVVLPSSRRQPYTLTTCSHITCSHTTYSHTTCTHTHTACSHTTCSYTTYSSYSHTTCSHTTYSHQLTHNLLTHNLLTQLAHTQLTRTQLAHTQLTHTQLTHTQLAHTQLTPGVALAWQAWHLETCSCTLRGRRGTLRHPPSFHVAGVARMALGWLWWRARFSAVAVVAAAFCVTGVALGDM